MNDDKIVKLPSKTIEEGSVVRLKSGSPTMTVTKIRTIVLCNYYNPEQAEFLEAEFFEHELLLDAKKVDQDKY